MTRWPAWLAAAVVLSLTLGTLAAVGWRADATKGLSAADWSAVRFTLQQAFISAFISVGLAVFVARALARRQFRGRGVLITLLGAPFLLPVIVAIFGLLAVFGRQGVLNQGIGALGFDPISIYGFHGVVLAHVFFNLPLATRLILQGWLSVPAEQFRLAAMLGAPVSRLIEAPMLRAVLPGAFLVVFLICLTSFAVALTLGGGPRATTVELAIYQALRFDFDLGRAALLGCLQFLLCALAALAVWFVTPPATAAGGLGCVVQRWDHARKWVDYALIIVVALFLLTPLLMVATKGVMGLSHMPVAVWAAALRSVLVAVASASLCCAMAVTLAVRGGLFAAIIGALPLAASALVVGTGVFIVLLPIIRPADLALPVTMFVNAGLALPFALRAIAPQVAGAQADYARLSAALSLAGWAWVRIVLLPRIRPALGFGAGLAAALSMGDLGVIALFADRDQATLPYLMFQLMGAYQMPAAAGVGLILVVSTFAIFAIFDRWGGRDAGI